jgi:DNA modification methylase
VSAADVLEGDALRRLRDLPDELARTCVTSPPYYWQRDYGHPEQYGLEATPTEYVERLVAVAREVRRVLTRDGTLWLNVGDSYNSRVVARPSSHHPGFGHETAHNALSWAEHRAAGRARLATNDGGLKDKDLIGIPAMIVQALRADGWWWRAEVIWAKTFCLPDPAPDRPARVHETIMLLSRSARYFYDPPEPLRSVWTIAPSNADDDHGAAFPLALARRMVLATSEPGDVVLDPFAGSCTVGVVAAVADRGFVGIELDPIAAASGRARLARDSAQGALL